MFYFKGTRKPDFRNIKGVDYDEYWRNRGFQLRSKLMEREIIFYDWIKPNSKVFDIACGNSRLLHELKNKKCIVRGGDISSLAVNGQSKAGIEAIIMNLNDTDYSQIGSQNYIILSEVLEHLVSPEDVVLKLSENTDYFLISIPNSAFYRYRLGLMFKGRFFTQWAKHPSEHLRFWSHIDFLNWLEAMNLEVVNWQSSNGFQFKNIWPNMFGHQICYLAKVKK